MDIKQLTDREHIILRPSMYIGSVSRENSTEYLIDINNKLSLKDVTYTPALLKIINEVIDNSIDIILKSKRGDNVSIFLNKNNNSVSVFDNSIGFPVTDYFNKKTENKLKLALGNARSGSNFEESVGQIGLNGVGAFATNCFSKQFKVTSKSRSSEKALCCVWTNNAKDYTETTLNFENILKDYDITNSLSGTLVEFYPDLEKLNETSLSNDLLEVLKARLYGLALTFDKIKFSLNGEEIKPYNLESLFDPEFSIIHKTNDYTLCVCVQNEKKPNYTFLNGLYLKDDGTHVDIIYNDINKHLNGVKGIECSKTDIVNTFQIIFFGKNFKNLKFNSQTKEKITNSTTEVKQYLGELNSFYEKLVKNKNVKEFIKATISARKLRTDKNKLNKIKKAKVLSDKFLDSKGNRDCLVLVEGDSALGGLAPALGREGLSYYALKGKPLNSFECGLNKVVANKELSELLNIIHNSNLKKIILATDQDLDGFHIRGLLIAFIFKHAKELLDKIYILQTPVRGVMNKQGKLVRWSYNLEDELTLKKGETSQYYKGLGSWDRDDLQHVIKTEGINNLLIHVNIDDKDILGSWLGSDSTPRKDFIINNNFNISKI